MYSEEDDNEWMMSRIKRRVAAICDTVDDALVVVAVGENSVYYDTIHGVIQSMTKATGPTTISRRIAIEQAHHLSDVMQTAAYNNDGSIEEMVVHLACVLAQN